MKLYLNKYNIINKIYSLFILILFNVDVVAKKILTNILVHMHPDGHV